MKVSDCRWAAFGLAVSVVLFTAAASAEQAEGEESSSPKTAQPSPPPDVVVLKNGGMIRGTIAESIPGESVTIIGLSGDPKTIDAADVEYAGPSDRMPAAEATAPPSAPPGQGASEVPEPPPTSGEARFSFEANEPSITLMVMTDSAVGVAQSGTATAVSSVQFMERVCTAPCEASLKPGSYRFVLQRPDGSKLFAGHTTVEDGMNLKGTITPKPGWMTPTGVVLGLAGVGAMAYSFTFLLNKETVCETSFAGEQDCHENLDPQWVPYALLMGGGAVGMGVGWYFIFRGDSAEIGASAAQAPRRLTGAKVGYRGVF